MRRSRDGSHRSQQGMVVAVEYELVLVSQFEDVQTGIRGLVCIPEYAASTVSGLVQSRQNFVFVCFIDCTADAAVNGIVFCGSGRPSCTPMLLRPSFRCARLAGRRAALLLFRLLRNLFHQVGGVVENAQHRRHRVRCLYCGRHCCFASS